MLIAARTSGYNPPQFALDAAKEALDKVECNQYSPTKVWTQSSSFQEPIFSGMESPCLPSTPQGRPRLKKAIADAYSPSFGRQLNPDTEVTITTGANEGLSVSFCWS